MPRCRVIGVLAAACLACRGRSIALDVAEAVAYLHGEARILHSDIK